MNTNRILKGICKCYQCGYSFTYQSDTLLTCSGYRTKGVCEYLSWKETDVLDLIEFHLEREEVDCSEANIKSHIDKIKLGKNGVYEIQLKNGKVVGYDGFTYKL